MPPQPPDPLKGESGALVNRCAQAVLPFRGVRGVSADGRVYRQTLLKPPGVGVNLVVVSLRLERLFKLSVLLQIPLQIHLIEHGFGFFEVMAGRLAV